MSDDKDTSDEPMRVDTDMVRKLAEMLDGGWFKRGGSPYRV